MYKQIKDLHNKLGPAVFAMVVSHLLQVGINTIKNIADKDIAELKGSEFFTKEFEQKICVNAKELANIIADNPIALIQYCMAEELFDTNIFVPFEEKVFGRIIWKNKDIISTYEGDYGKTPTTEQVEEIIDNIDFDELEDCSYGWDVIYKAFRNIQILETYKKEE